MNNIVKEENKQENIELLQAQAAVYVDIQKTSIKYFCINVLIPILLVGAKILCPNIGWLNTITWIVSLVCSFASVIVLSAIRKKKTLAASIQQLFDSRVLGLKLNNNLILPPKESIEKYKVIKTRKEGDFANWYNPRIANYTSSKGRLLAMSENLNFDHGLRFYYLVFSISLSLFSVLIGLYLLVHYDFSFLIPFSALYIWLFRMIYCLSSNINENKNIKEKFQKILNMSISGKNPSITDFKFLQEMIFNFRKSAFKVPDWFFHLMRKFIEVHVDHRELQILEALKKL